MQHTLPKSEITKAKILAAAEAEFSEKGYFGARVDEIAVLAGVNKRMIYQHYESKDGLYQAALLSVYGKLAECEARFCVDNLDPALAIKNIVYTYFRFLEETPSFVRMLMWENLNYGRSISSEQVRRLKEPTINYIKEQLRRGREKSLFRDDVDEYQVIVSITNFGFSYFSNIHTLSALFGKDMTDSQEILKRAEYVSNLILKDLLK
jgi:TetR/AcrR family transcriptional regulator